MTSDSPVFPVPLDDPAVDWDSSFDLNKRKTPLLESEEANVDWKTLMRSSTPTKITDQILLSESKDITIQRPSSVSLLDQTFTNKSDINLNTNANTNPNVDVDVNNRNASVKPDWWSKYVRLAGVKNPSAVSPGSKVVVDTNTTNGSTKKKDNVSGFRLPAWMSSGSDESPSFKIDDYSLGNAAGSSSTSDHSSIRDNSKTNKVVESIRQEKYKLNRSLFFESEFGKPGRIFEIKETRKDGLLIDTWNHVNNYPNIASTHKSSLKNLDFYRGIKPCMPDKLFIDDFHSIRWKDYRALESGHGYIQWLFPIRTKGMNSESDPLHPTEIEYMASDPDIMLRFGRSYILMLNFYGLRLVNRKTGEVGRDIHALDRYKAWANPGNHNLLRITRILKCLSELRLDNFQLELCKHFVREMNLGLLVDLEKTANDYWFPLFRDKSKYEILKVYIKDHPVWIPTKTGDKPLWEVEACKLINDLTIQETKKRGLTSTHVF